MELSHIQLAVSGQQYVLTCIVIEILVFDTKDLWCRSLKERIHLKLIFLKKGKLYLYTFSEGDFMATSLHFIYYLQKRPCMFLFFNLFSKHFLLESKRLLQRQVKPCFSKKLTFENRLHAKSANDTNERAKEVCLHGISRFSMKSTFKTWFLGKICL